MRFRRLASGVLIATDVAARGIDVNDLTHVFHFALPNDQAYYTHRSGRTARAGKKGISMSLIGFKEKYKIHNLEKGLGVEFARVEVPLADAVVETRLRSWAMGLMAENAGAAPPQDLVDQIDLLLGPLSKEDMIARLVARELGRLNLGHRADLNDRGPKGKKPGYKKDFKGGTSAGGFKKPFKKGGYKKDDYGKGGYKKGGYKSGGYKKKPTWDDDGFNTGDGDFKPREGNGGYRKSLGAKKGGFKKGKPGGFKKGPGGPKKGGYKKKW